MNPKAYCNQIIDYLQSRLKPEKIDYNLLIRHSKTGITEIIGAHKKYKESDRLETSLILYKDEREICGWSKGEEFQTCRNLTENLTRKLQSGEYHSINVLPQKGFLLKRELEIYDPEIEKLSEESRKNLISEYLESLLDANGSISSVSDISLMDSIKTVFIYHSSGFSQEYISTSVSLKGLVYFRRDSQIRSDEFDFRSRRLSEIEKGISEFIPEVVEYPEFSGSLSAMPAVFRPMVMGKILELVARCLNPDSPEFDASPIHAKMGRKIAHSQIDIYDDGLLLGGPYTVPYDDEGINSQSTPIITEGRLRNILTDNRRARELKGGFTGNGFRTFGECTRIRPTNFLLIPIAGKSQDLAEIYQKCLEITRLEIERFDPLTGNMEMISDGYLREKGNRVSQFNRMKHLGNLYKILQHVDTVGNDIGWSGHFGSPSVGVVNITN